MNKDLPFTLKQLEKDVSDSQLRKLVGDKFLKVVENSVEKPIEAVKELAASKSLLSVNSSLLLRQLFYLTLGFPCLIPILPLSGFVLKDRKPITLSYVCGGDLMYTLCILMISTIDV